MSDQIEIPESFPRPGAVSGKRVVITGAARGLGAVLAHAFSHAGASVALVARTERDLKEVAHAFLGARAAARVMREGGRRIFTGSVLGERPRKGLTAYSASKSAFITGTVLSVGGGYLLV